jgi:hypothetical protein
MLNGTSKRGFLGIAWTAWFFAVWIGELVGPETAAAEERRSSIVETLKAVKGKIGGTAAPAEPAAPPADADSDPPRVILRLHGAPALGNSFIPKLVAQFVALALAPTGQQMVVRSGLVSPSASGEQTVRQASSRY